MRISMLAYCPERKTRNLQRALQLAIRGLRQPRRRADDGFVATKPRPLPMRPRSLRLVLALLTVLAVALGLASTPAGAIVTADGSATVGLQPRSTALLDGLGGLGTEPAKFANKNGNPVLSANDTYAIYWDPTDHYHGDWQHLIDTFFQSLGGASGSFASVFAVDTQYTDAANHHALYKSTFMGAYTDTNAYPVSGCEDPHPLESGDRIGPIVKEEHTPVCVTDKQIQEELERFVAQHSLRRGMEAIFYLMTPPGVTVCLDAGGLNGHCSDYHKSVYLVSETEVAKKAKEHEEEISYKDSFCSYHSDISPTNPITGDSNTILYGVVPWIAGGLADGDLAGNDRTSAYDCQDGGVDPSSKPIETREKRKQKTKVEEEKEAEEFGKMNQEEQEKALLKILLEGPHQEEPNQQPCPTPDGFCDTGLADLIVGQIGAEQQNIVTNPLLDAWQDPKANEAADECRNFFAYVVGGSVSANEETGAGTLYNQTFTGNNYYLNDAFNLAALNLPYPAIPCLPGIRLEPQFTAPNQVNSGEIVGFNGMESDISLDAGYDFSPAREPHLTYATYTWSFGDGSAPVAGLAPGAPSANSPAVAPCPSWELPCAASAFHSYQYGGTYSVTLTVTDVGGNTASVTHPITVAGPPPPSPEAPSGPGGSPGSGGGPAASPVVPSKAATTVVSTPPTPPTPAPVVTGFAASTSLKKALKSGLPVRYTTNEQVAGSIQVLLESSIAKRLGVHGGTATGLAPGTPSSIVVGTAVLVTTKAGQGTIRIKFSSRNASRLKHVRKLKLMLRLFARNASRQSPQTTTSLSTVILNP
jgi:hypothetical protein